MTYATYIDQKIDMALALRSGVSGAGYTEAAIILASLLSGISADIWPREKHDRNDKRRFVELWSCYAEPALATNRISIPLLVQDLLSKKDSVVVEKLAASLPKTFSMLSKPTKILTGEDIDVVEDELISSCSPLTLEGIRKFSYGVDADAQEAVRWYRLAAEQGHAHAQCNLGLCYGRGIGIEKNEKTAVYWLHKAAKQRDAFAQGKLGVAFENGLGVETNEEEAVRWYQKAAEQGDAGAQCNLGVRYLNGTGVDADAHEAVRWFRKAAEQGEAVAQYNLGFCYATGMGAEKDGEKRVYWYRKAAEQGYAVAQSALGICYCLGSDVPKDEKEATRWIRMAAEKGNAVAQYNLGVGYYNGTGVQKSFVEAYKWFNLAAAQGHQAAVEARDELEAEMSVPDVSRAQRMSTEFVEQHQSDRQRD